MALTPDAFRAAYCGTFEPDPLLPQAVALWHSYYVQCESYDRTVCTGPMGRDGVMPANPEQRAIINRHAKWRHEWLARASVDAGIPDETMQRAREIALRER